VRRHVDESSCCPSGIECTAHHCSWLTNERVHRPVGGDAGVDVKQSTSFSVTDGGRDLVNNLRAVASGTNVLSVSPSHRVLGGSKVMTLRTCCPIKQVETCSVLGASQTRASCCNSKHQLKVYYVSQHTNIDTNLLITKFCFINVYYIPTYAQISTVNLY